MLEKLKALMSLFRQGSAVADPAKWKAHQITTTMLAGLLIAAVQLAKAFGYEVPVDPETATAIAGGVLALTNTVLTVVTSKHAGLPTGQVREAEQALPGPTQAADGVSSVPHLGQADTGIDESTRAAAIEWAARQRGQSDRGSTNGLSNDA